MDDAMGCAPNIDFVFEQVGKNKTRVVVTADGEPLEVHTFNLGDASKRDAFVKALIAKVPGLEEPKRHAEIEARLLSEAARAISTPARSDSDLSRPELDVGHIVRPELFHTPDVSGVAVPITVRTEEGPRGAWSLYLRWHADGRRERVTLAGEIRLPNDETVWLCPLPGEPSTTTRPAWSEQSRAAWLNGHDAPSPADVFRRICNAVSRFVYFSDEAGKGDISTLTLWSMLTYVYPAWTAIPYLSVGGTKESGKSRTFEVLSRLVFRPTQSSNMTAACLFRTLHDTGGTLLLDEAERLRDRAPDVGELRSILLSGYKAGSPARRLEPLGDGRFQPVCFNVFGPKALAAIARLPDALASRCIRLTMFRAPPGAEHPRRRIDEDPALWSRLRDDLHILALERGRQWLRLADTPGVCPVMTGRQYELWQPLLGMASLIEKDGADGLLGFMQNHATESSEASQEDTTNDADETLLRIVVDVVREGRQSKTTASAILDKAREVDRTVFERWSPRGASAALARFQIRTARSNGVKTYRDVTLEHLRRIESTYGLDLGLGTCP